MNDVTKTEGAALAVTMGFNDLASFEFMQRTAKMFSASTIRVVPWVLRNRARPVRHWRALRHR